MKYFTHLLIIASVIIALTTSLFADWRLIRAKSYQLMPPPVPGSEMDKEDFKILHQYQNERTKAQCDIANSQSMLEFEALFGSDTGMLDKKEIEALKPFIKQIFAYTTVVSTVFKTKYMRDRPYNRDQTLKPCAMKPGGHKAYPSSHAAAGLLGGLVLGKIFSNPAENRAEKLEAHGYQIGTYRVLVGVHHPSDIKAGQSLALQMMAKLSKDKSFQKDLAEAKEGLE